MRNKSIYCLIMFILYAGVFALSEVNSESEVYAQDVDFSSPEATFRTYMQACRELDFNKSDLCYTKEFQMFAKTNKVYLSHRHKGQLRNEYNDLRGRNYKLEMHGNKAIMRFAPEFKRPAPLYFVKEGGEWKIDAMFAFKNIIMDDRTGGWFWKYSNNYNEKHWLRK